MKTVNFKQEREFGELFNATFSFIGSEMGKLGKAVLYYVVPFLLLASILGVFLSTQNQAMINNAGAELDALTTMFTQIGIYGVLSAILTIIASTTLTCTILGYIKLYVAEGPEEITLSAIAKQISKNFGIVLLASILSAIIIGVGMIFCFIPGIYLGVSMSVLLPALVIEGEGFSSALSRSFKLVKSNFWVTLAILIIVLILVYIVSIVFSLPAIIMGLEPLFKNMSNPEQADFEFGIGFYIANSISSLLTYLVAGIPTVLLAFHYYNLVEREEKPSLAEKIQNISENE